jgi:proteasome lid subunit RPN8/RPN11
MNQLILRQEHWDAMLDHVESCRPFEGCGLLSGRGDVVHAVLPITNEEQSRTRYRMDPSEQLRAFNDMDDADMELLGIFHSHPADPTGDRRPVEGPSETDIAESAYPVVYIIWSRADGGWQARGFRIEAGEALEVPLRIATVEE